MEVPDMDQEIWRDIVTGRTKCPLKFLATKILLGRLTRSVKENRSPENIVANARQLHNLFLQNAYVPSVQEDLKTLLSLPGSHVRKG